MERIDESVDIRDCPGSDDRDDIIGLHPDSVEYAQRHAESLQEVFNRLNLEALASVDRARAEGDIRTLLFELLARLEIRAPSTWRWSMS